MFLINIEYSYVQNVVCLSWQILRIIYTNVKIVKIIKTGSITDLIRHIKGAIALVKGSYLIPLDKKKETIKIKY